MLRERSKPRKFGFSRTLGEHIAKRSQKPFSDTRVSDDMQLFNFILGALGHRAQQVMREEPDMSVDVAYVMNCLGIDLDSDLSAFDLVKQTDLMNEYDDV